jgi:hypothetical protein
MLFGTPKRGLNHEILNTMVEGQPNSGLLNDLIVDGDNESSPYLQALDCNFRTRFTFPESPILSFYERHTSRTAVGLLKSYKGAQADVH